MNAEETPSQIFKHDYKLLDLDDRADWKNARASYRRLVHQWHPDKYSHRPREKVHAQQQFIELTKSYNSLRSFHRIHQRLPFEPASKNASFQTETPASGDEKATKSAEQLNTFEKGILGRESEARTKTPVHSITNSKLFWIFTAFSMMIATVAVFLVLDLNANKANIEKGKEVLRQAPASDFMPSAAEIRKSQTRGAFIQPTK